MRQQFGAVSSETQVIRGIWEHQGQSYCDGLVRVLVDVAGRSANSQMKWASKVGAKWAVFVPKGEDGYAVRDMTAGKDEPKQRSIEELRSWLLKRREPVESTR